MEDKSKLLTCIIITYNQSKYLFDAIASVLSQDYSDIELIIADDCSKDFDKESIEKYIDNNKKPSLTNYIVYSNDCNEGTVKNINRAIEKASGTYVKIFGGDDMLANASVFSSQVKYLKSNPSIYIVTGKSIQCDDRMNEIYDRNVQKNNLLISAVISANTKKEKLKIIRKNYIFPFMTQAMCFRKDFFNEYGMYDEDYQLLEDTPMMNRIIDQGINVGFQEIYVIKHRTKVGVSSADILYSSRSLRYYEDCKLLAEKSLNTSESIIDYVRAKQRFRISSLRVELCQKNSKKDKLLCYMHYSPNILIYLIQNPKKSIKKIINRLNQ